MKDLIGKKFGRLTVISLHSKEQRIRQGVKDGYFYKYNCKCECGKNIIVTREHLKSGHTQSCGCLHKEKIKKINGLYKDNKRLYYIWRGILSRCFNKNNREYKNYGGRGISISKHWKNSFVNFYNWSIKNGYKKDLTIERKDVNGNYTPENCCWIMLKEQSFNKRNTIMIEIKGDTKCLQQWCDIFNVKRYMIYSLMKKYNIKHKDALLTLIGGSV